MNIIKLTFLNILLFSYISSAQAELLWNWKIDNPAQIVNVTETISITGTITNDLTSTSSLTFEQAVGQVIPVSLLSAQGDFTADKFIADDGPIGQSDFLSQFSGVQIVPGQSFSFMLYSYIPVGESVTLGVYRNPYNGLYLSGTSSGFIDGGGVQVTLVPEPTSAALIISGLVLLAGFSRKTKYSLDI